MQDTSIVGDQALCTGEMHAVAFLTAVASGFGCMEHRLRFPEDSSGKTSRAKPCVLVKHPLS